MWLFHEYSIFTLSLERSNVWMKHSYRTKVQMYQILKKFLDVSFSFRFVDYFLILSPLPLSLSNRICSYMDKIQTISIHFNSELDRYLYRTLIFREIFLSINVNSCLTTLQQDFRSFYGSVQY